MMRNKLKTAALTLALACATAAGAQAASLSASAIAEANAARAADPLPAAVPAERRTIELEGFGRVAFYIDERGEGGRPLLLTHSINAAASAAEMRPLFEAYAGQRPVIALEWPGFGSSSRPDVVYTPELMASALDTFVNELGRDVDVVSLSLGNEFAARAALDNPRIKSLVMISPTGLGEPRGEPQQNAAEAGASTNESYQRLRQFSGPLYGAVRSYPSIKYFLGLSFVGQVDEDLLNYAYRTSRAPGAKYAPLYFLSGGLFNADAYANLYSKLEVPTLVIYDQDAFVNFDRLPLLEEKSNVQAVRIMPTDGLPQFEATRRVVEAMNQFYMGQ